MWESRFWNLRYQIWLFWYRTLSQLRAIVFGGEGQRSWSSRLKRGASNGDEPPMGLNDVDGSVSKPD